MSMTEAANIASILASDQITISCELFPPKSGAVFDAPDKVLQHTAELHPTFISVTCGAGRGGSGIDARTVAYARKVQERGHITALAHLTCINATQAEVQSTLDELAACGVRNILALRGDVLPASATGSSATKGPYQHANELVAAIREHGGFCVGGACYPEGHPESASLAADMQALAAKVEAGCEFLTTQMFFDNGVLYNFLYRMLSAGINVPVVAGIMPVTSGRQIKRICKLTGAALPSRFKAIVDRFAGEPAAMAQAGVAYATAQVIDLIANGVNHIHIYTMNKPAIAGAIMANCSELLR
jgi:methylenetetrahydrofolate reductase (NADPH)